MEHILQYRPVNSLTGNDRDLITGDDDLIDDESNPMQSPILSAQEETKIRKVRSMQANGGFTFNFTKRFSFRNSTGMRYQTSRQDIFYGEKSITGKRSSINGNIAYNENGSFQTSNVFTYDYRGKTHKLNVMAGQEWISRWSKYLGAYATTSPHGKKKGFRCRCGQGHVPVSTTTTACFHSSHVPTIISGRNTC